MEDPISDLPQKEQGGLLTIDGYSIVEESHMFERGMYFYVFYFCFLLSRYHCVRWRNRCRKRGIRTWMRRSIPEWKTVGRSNGGMFLRMLRIRVIFMPWCGVNKHDRRSGWLRDFFGFPFRIRKGGTLFGPLLRIILSRKRRTTKLLEYAALIINDLNKRGWGF